MAVRNMNKLLIPNGGMPLDGDDFGWIHEGNLEAFRGAIWWAIAGAENKIIRGGEITLVGLDASITEGFAVIGGEICYIPAHTVTVSALATSSLKVDETYDVDGLEVFADSISRNTYAIRRAKISDGLSGGDEIPLDNPDRIFYQQTFTSFSGGWLVAGGFTVKATLFNGMVSLQGAMTGGDTDLSTVFTLPAIFRPTQQKSFATIVNRTLALDAAQIVVDTDGDISFFEPSVGSVGGTERIYLDPVCYYK